MATLDPANVADIVAEAFRQSREFEYKKRRDKDPQLELSRVLELQASCKIS